MRCARIDTKTGMLSGYYLLGYDDRSPEWIAEANLIFRSMGSSDRIISQDELESIIKNTGKKSGIELIHALKQWRNQIDNQTK